MDKLRYILLSGMMLLSFSTFAQQNSGKVTVVKDPRIDSLIARRIALNKGVSANGSPIVVNGYRIQIFFGPDRNEVYQEQARFKTLYPEYNTYISYTQPNYRLKIGDFRTKMEAQRVLNDLRPIFPTLFIFNEKINPPKANP